MEDLTDEQRERIARNRQLALERKRKRELESGQDAQRKHGAFTPGRSLSSGSQCVSEATDVSRATSQIHSFKEQAPSAVNYTSGSAAIQSHHERCSATTSDSTVPSSGSSCTLPVTSHSLTAEQQAIREKNRLLAIERRKRVLQQQVSLMTNVDIGRLLMSGSLSYSIYKDFKLKKPHFRWVNRVFQPRCE